MPTLWHTFQKQSKENSSLRRAPAPAHRTKDVLLIHFYFCPALVVVLLNLGPVIYVRACLQLAEARALNAFLSPTLLLFQTHHTGSYLYRLYYLFPNYVVAATFSRPLSGKDTVWTNEFFLLQQPLMMCIIKSSEAVKIILCVNKFPPFYYYYFFLVLLLFNSL